MQRFLLKLSGEALGSKGFDQIAAQTIASQIADCHDRDRIQLAVLIGGGNIWRGRDAKDFGFAPAYSDMIGMGATMLNALVLAGALSQTGISARIFSSLPFSPDVRPHDISAEIAALESGQVIIFAGGTGCPFFTTDSAAVLRALEIEADAVLKGTKVDGVYDSDPIKNPAASRFSNLSFDEALAKDLRIMDATAFALARENQLPIYVFDAFRTGGIADALSATPRSGTWIRAGGEK